MIEYFNIANLGKSIGNFRIAGIEKSEFSGNAIWALKCNKCNEITHIMAEMLFKGDVVKCNCGNSYKNDNKAKEIIINEKEVSTVEVNYNWQVSNKDKQRLRKIRQVIMSRCYNESDTSYHLYGGIGIGVEYEWLQDIQKFIDWSINNGYRPWLNLRRRNKDGDYNKENCYWGNGKETQTNLNNDIDISKYRQLGIDEKRILKDISNGTIDSKTVITGLEEISKAMNNQHIDPIMLGKLLKSGVKELGKCVGIVQQVINKTKVYRYIQCNKDIEDKEYTIITLNKVIHDLTKLINKLNK